MDINKVIVYAASNKHSVTTQHVLGEGKGIPLSENDYFQIILESASEIAPGHRLWLGDFSFQLETQPVANSFLYLAAIDTVFNPFDREKFSYPFSTQHGTLRLYKLFLNYFGKCTIELEIPHADKSDFVQLGFIDIRSDKITEINGLLEYLFEKEFFFWNIVSLTKVTAQEEDKLSENVFWKLCSIREICNVFKNEFLVQIPFSKISKLTPVNMVRMWREHEIISDASLLWYVENANHLILTTVTDENHFLLLNKPYKTDVVYSETLQESTDVYENQLVHWFVNLLYTFLNQTKEIIKRKHERYSGKEDSLKFSIYASFFKRMLVLTSEMELEIEEIKARLYDYIPVSKEEIDSIQDQRLHNKGHYRSIYIALIKWLENKQVNYQPDVLFSGLKDVSKLYEVFCLFKIFDSLINDLKFKPTKNSSINPAAVLSFDAFSTDDISMLSRYDFERGNHRLTVFYDQLPPGLTTIAHSGGKGYRPDFVFELNIDGAYSYFIMDAKYKSISNIENFDYTDLTLKYLHGVGPVAGGTFPVYGLFVLNPIAFGGVKSYHRYTYSLDGPNISLPAIGRIEVSVEKNQKNQLSKIISKIIDVCQDLAYSSY